MTNANSYHKNMNWFPGSVSERMGAMLGWALLFLIFALIAGALGFFALEGLGMWIAKVLFVLFLIFTLISFVLGRRAPPV